MNLTQLELSTCPLCDSTVSVIPETLKTYVRSTDNIIESEFSVCTDCDFAYMSNPFDAESMQYYYSNNDQLRRENLTQEEAHHISSQIGFLGRYLDGKSPRLLEIGADTGSFLQMSKLELGTNGYFLEYNPEAKKHLEFMGFKDAEQEKGLFDAVVIRHTLEHIVDPIEFLQELGSRVTEDAPLFIEVPDCSALSLQLSDNFQLEHVNYFTLSSMARLARRAGYVVTASELARTPGYSTTPNQVLRIILHKVIAPNQSISHRVEDWAALMDKTTGVYSAIRSFMVEHPDYKFSFYGAGTRTVEFFAFLGEELQIDIYDGDPKKVGTTLFGNEVKFSENLKAIDIDHIFVMVVGYEAEVLGFLQQKGVNIKCIHTLSSI